MKEVPQINTSTGIGSGYFSEYNTKAVLLEMDATAEKMGFSKDRTARLAELCRGYPIKKYEEHFPPTEFLNVITDKNRGAVSRLDEIAGEANKRFIDPTNFTLDDFKNVVVEVHSIVYGSSAGYNPRF